MGAATRSLKRLLAERACVVACGAHDALSAKLVEQAGFDAVWASGFGLSAVRAVPDASILTMSETLEATRAMVEATSIPVIADCDTGFGNAINVMRTVADFEAAGVAAISIEDNVFPKRCSFYAGVARELVPTEEHARKVAAAKAAQKADDFVVIARTEALIAGLGEAEALRRAAAYEEAGADMILIHSKQKAPDEVESFVRAWQGRLPIVIVPTAYPEMNETRVRALGKIAMVIYGNHAIRACVTAMQDVFARIRKDGGIQNVNNDIVSVEEIFRLQRMDQVKADEKKFLR